MPEFYTVLIAHLVGDFLFQTHAMASKKRSSSLWCTFHVLIYAIPLALVGCEGLLLYSICMEHWIQDRFSVARRWMQLVGQSSEKDWPTGPIIVDQVLHMVFMLLFYSVAEVKSVDRSLAYLPNLVLRLAETVSALG